MMGHSLIKEEMGMRWLLGTGRNQSGLPPCQPEEFISAWEPVQSECIKAIGVKMGTAGVMRSQSREDTLRVTCHTGTCIFSWDERLHHGQGLLESWSPPYPPFLWPYSRPCKDSVTKNNTPPSEFLTFCGLCWV